MSLSDIRVLYLRELRGALRERSIVVNSILLPIFLYPIILWLAFTGITFVQGLQEGFVSRVAVFGLPVAHAELSDSLRAMESVETRDTFASTAAAEEAVRVGELDAVLEFRGEAGTPPVAGGGNGGAGSEADAGVGSSHLASSDFRVRIAFDRSESRSERAEQRLTDLIDRYRDRWIEREGRDLGLSGAELTVMHVDRHNVSSDREMGAFLLSEMVPVFLVIMVALGCFVPAVDSTAGERERSTWETTMSLAASRSSVIVAKYLYVATLGTAAGILNILAMTASIGAILGPLMGEEAASMQFEYPLMALPVMVLGAVILALFFAAAMMILASFARTFKDGQSMVTPVYWLALFPLFLGQAPDQHLGPGFAAIPIANVALMIRDAIQGVFRWVYIAESFAVGVILVVGALALARWILSFENVLLGSYDGSFWKFLKERRARS